MVSRGTVTLFLCLTCQVGLCQHLELEVETGINSSGLPRRFSATERKLPRISPVVGASVRYQSRAGFYSLLGVRYTVVGQKLTSHVRRYSLLDEFWTTADETETYSFHKISCSVGLGYKFKKRLDVILGYRKTHVPSGRFTYHFVFTEPSGVTLELRKDFDPVNNPALVERAASRNWEIYAGAGVEVADRVRIVLQYSVPNRIYFSESGGHTQHFFHAYTANDISITAFFKIAR